MKKILFSALVIGIFNFYSITSYADEKPLLFNERQLNEQDFIYKADLVSGKLDLELIPALEKLTGKAEYKIINNDIQPVNKVFLGLNSGLKINNVSLGNFKVKEIVKENDKSSTTLGYVISFDKTLNQGESTTLTINYEGSILGNYKFGRIKDNDIYLTSGSFFYPRFDIVKNKSSKMELNIKLPDNYKFISSGQQDNYTLNTNGLDNDKGFNIAAAKYKLFNSGNINIYYKDLKDKELLNYMANFEKKSLNTLTGLFGVHQSKYVNIVEVNRDDLGGMASFNTIYLSDKNFGDYLNNAKQQYNSFKSIYGNNEFKLNNEFKYYLRNVLAHESTHLFFNHKYTYDKPWFAEGFPEFISLKILKDNGEKTDIDRKIKEYKIYLKSIENNKLPSLNEASFNSQAGYLVNYWGTPLVLYDIWQSHESTFWKDMKTILENNTSISYETFKKDMNINPEFIPSFENEFKLKE